LPWTLSSVRLKTIFGIAHQRSANAAAASYAAPRSKARLGAGQITFPTASISMPARPGGRAR
jgi:hypothetical protein